MAAPTLGRPADHYALDLEPHAGRLLSGEETIAPGSTVLTDGWHSYRALSGSYQHRPTVIGDPKIAAKQLPRVHRAFANLKTWLLGTHRR